MLSPEEDAALEAIEAKKDNRGFYPMPKPVLITVLSVALVIMVASFLSYRNGDRPTRNNQTKLEQILCKLNPANCPL